MAVRHCAEHVWQLKDERGTEGQGAARRVRESTHAILTHVSSRVTPKPLSLFSRKF